MPVTDGDDYWDGLLADDTGATDVSKIKFRALRRLTPKRLGIDWA